MKRGVDERRGRIILGGMLLLVLLVQVAPWLVTVPLESILLPGLALELLSLLPAAAILWAVWRGCQPALVIFVISTVLQLGDVVGMFQFGAYAQLPGPLSALLLIELLLRLTVALSIWRQEQVERYWQLRQYARRRKDLYIEIGVFVLALGFSLLLPGVIYQLVA